jgi:hypothetical protein
MVKVLTSIKILTFLLQIKMSLPETILFNHTITIIENGKAVYLKQEMLILILLIKHSLIEILMKKE